MDTDREGSRRKQRHDTERHSKLWSQQVSCSIRWSQGASLANRQRDLSKAVVGSVTEYAVQQWNLAFLLTGLKSCKINGATAQMFGSDSSSGLALVAVLPFGAQL